MQKFSLYNGSSLRILFYWTCVSFLFFTYFSYFVKHLLFFFKFIYLLRQKESFQCLYDNVQSKDVSNSYPGQNSVN